MTTTTDRGKELRRWREQLGVTRAQLAGLAGCSVTTLGNIEQGYTPRVSPALDRAFAALARVEQDR